jgi:hypothetical protein
VLAVLLRVGSGQYSVRVSHTRRLVTYSGVLQATTRDAFNLNSPDL